MDLADFYQGLSDFRKVFTLKHMVVLFVVGLALVAVCGPSDVSTDTVANSCDTACPFPPAKVINIPEIRIEEISQENWSYDVYGKGWSRKDPSTPEIKSKIVNLDKDCMVFFVKESDNTDYAAYVIGTIRAFATEGTWIDSVSQVSINDQKFVLAEINTVDKAIWSWITVKDNVGYSLTCGCDIDLVPTAEQKDLCQFSGDSIRIR